MKTGTLYLIPSPLGQADPDSIIPGQVLQLIRRLDVFVVEHPKTARSYLKQVGTITPLQQIEILTLDEHTTEIEPLLAPLKAGRDMGLISEAGCPAVADPGSSLVKLAHDHGIRVAPLVGPSSILLALMASGLEGQRFAFHGYLPVEASARAKKIRELEQESKARRQTQIFIETPYRNLRLYDALVENCRSSTQLCIAADLTLASETVETRSIDRWKSSRPEIDKRPAIFLIKA